MPKKKTVKEEQPEIPEMSEQTPEETVVPAAEEQSQAEAATEDTPLSEAPPDAEQNAEDTAAQSGETEQTQEQVPDDFGEPEPDKVEYDVENAPDFCGSSIDILSVSGETGEDASQTTEEPEMPVAVPEEEPTQQNEGDAPPESEPNIGETAPPAESVPQPEKPDGEEHRELNGRGAERRAFFGLNFRELDRGLLPEEQQEWNAIYASYRGRSVMSGHIAGIDPRVFRVRDRRTGEIRNHTIWCAVVIPFRIPILIPETEMWARGEERPRFVMRNMGDAMIDFVITDVDREKDYVVGSRRLALANKVAASLSSRKRFASLLNNRARRRAILPNSSPRFNRIQLLRSNLSNRAIKASKKVQNPSRRLAKPLSI